MDLIERQAAIDAIRSIKANYCETADDQILLIDKAMAMTELMMLPSAQPETHWTDKEIMPLPLDYQSMRCANCERYYTTPYLYYISEPNFCPHCGAATKGAKSDG